MTACTLGPLGYAIAGGDWDRWLTHAPGGAAIIYARGQALPRGSTAVIAAREAAAAGLVHLTSAVVVAEGRRETQWIATKRAAVIANRPRSGAMTDAIGAVDGDAAARVLRHLQGVALAGGPGPTNDEIARACGLKDREAARYQLAKLMRAGFVAQPVDHGPRERRIFTVTMPDGARCSTTGGGL